MSESEQSEQIIQSPLRVEHIRLGARFGIFGDHQIVHDYGIAVNEDLPLDHPLVLDLSFQGVLRVFGAGAAYFLQAVLTADVERLDHVGASAYSLILTSDADIIDLVYVTRTGESEYMIITDAPNTDEVYEWLHDNSRVALHGKRVFDNVEIEDQTDELARLCIMGKGSLDILDELARTAHTVGGKASAGSNNAGRGPRFSYVDALKDGIYFGTEISGIPMMLVSDNQVEGSTLIYTSGQAAVALWQAFMGFDELQAVGFDQYVSIRREKKLWLDGVDEGAYRKPSEAGLMHLVREGGGFAGARALQ